MANDLILNIVATECPPANDAKFNEWYNEVHIPLLFKYKGMKRVRRYKLMGENKDVPQYLAFYEFESKEAFENHTKSPEFAAAIQEMEETWKDGGWDMKWVASYEPIKTWER